MEVSQQERNNMTIQVKPQLYPLQEFLNRTGLSRSTAYREIGAGRLKVVRIGRTLRVSEFEICRYISQKENEA
jgi:excisionase family DNA binding protein